MLITQGFVGEGFKFPNRDLMDFAVARQAMAGSDIFDARPGCKFSTRFGDDRSDCGYVPWIDDRVDHQFRAAGSNEEITVPVPPGS